jgi:hypothetical protein
MSAFCRNTKPHGGHVSEALNGQWCVGNLSAAEAWHDRYHNLQLRATAARARGDHDSERDCLDALHLMDQEQAAKLPTRSTDGPDPMTGSEYRLADDLLAEIRRIVAIWSSRPPLESLDPGLGDILAAHIERLDQHLSGGGFLPDEWEHSYSLMEPPPPGRGVEDTPPL